MATTYNCSAHPWIDEAVKFWFQPAYKAARESEKTVEKSLEEIADIKWGKYPTGKSMGTLAFDEATGRYRVRFTLVSKHNEPHKPAGMQRLLERAVAAHSAELEAALGRKEMKFIFGTEDFPITYPHQKLRVPSFQMCTDPGSSDVPVPDFTWEIYNQAQYVNSSWWDIRRLLLRKGAMLPWKRRERDLFMRGDAGVGYRKVLMPVMKEVQANGTDLNLFGVRVNVHSTGFYVSDGTHFTWLDNWCQHRYLVHTSGFSYSASLKYKLACGAVVINFDSAFKEFYYPALQAGVHWISLKEASREELLTQVAPALKKELQDLEARYTDSPPPMAIAAREFAATQLTGRALGCYWLKALVAYSKLYFAATPAEVPKEPVASW
ncbi:hypothetical protein GPECTOR_54g176 [Gonium pectorale]|uniref:Glycosyl transferase CAP10 domain-containing protein n=1 Tax=Gonium pectorale TaxID=33097 RepID=A0A150G6C2_GONPE|nr:hypothetical protein GPECTOR_54g176 [Gonium pectorale]|eukprot:KXZ45436.1 hypothetical protein GPECTOR_54g176 [Gonium pectorale]